MSLRAREEALKAKAEVRLRDAHANLRAAVRETENAPDEDLAATWLEQATAEARDALAVAEEMGVVR